MDRERVKELLPIIQAFAEGKTIQWRGNPHNPWLTITYLGDISDTRGFEYRIKPEPAKPREWWVNEYDGWLGEPYNSRELADRFAAHDRLRCIHVREVLDDEEDG